MFNEGDKVKLSVAGSADRVPEMDGIEGIIIDYPVANSNWVAVLWNGKRQAWTEHRDNLIKVETGG